MHRVNFDLTSNTINLGPDFRTFNTGCLVTSIAWVADKNQLFLSGLRLDGQGNPSHSDGSNDTCSLLIACLIDPDAVAQNSRSKNTLNREYRFQQVCRTQQTQRTPVQKVVIEARYDKCYPVHIFKRRYSRGSNKRANS